MRTVIATAHKVQKVEWQVSIDIPDDLLEKDWASYVAKNADGFWTECDALSSLRITEKDIIQIVEDKEEYEQHKGVAQTD